MGVIMADDISLGAQPGQGRSLLNPTTTAQSVLDFWNAYDAAQTAATPAAGVAVGAGAGQVVPTTTTPTTQVQPQPVMQAVGAVPAVADALGISLPEGLVAGLGAVGALYAAYQALGGGEGGGILGNNLLGGDVSTIPGTNIILQGPGLPEPYPQQIVKEWSANGSQFYQLTDGRIAVYSKKTGRWKAFRPPKLAVIGKNLPSHKMLTRLRRNLKRHTDDAVTLLKVTAPNKLAKPKHHYFRRHK